MLLGPVLDTGSFLAPLSYNLGSNHGVGSLERMDRTGLGKLIYDGFVCPDQEVVWQLSGVGAKERGCEEARVQRMMMVGENMR